ncbi:MAG: GNAT family N-acetyltransferase [Candidatus Obscuribacterales bacterium]|jgi:RimJ/RimL family protein N-acetyltransferase
MRDVLIETANLQLRDFKQTDWKEVHKYSVDPEVVKYMEWGPNTTEQTLAFIDRVLLAQRANPRTIFEFAVIHREEERLIGACGIRVAQFDPRQADLGYCFNRSYWGLGFGSEAAQALIDFGFDKLKLHRAWATCDAENVGSARVLRKCGMRQEGHFIKDKNIKGHWRDTLLFAMLREEWDARRKSP